MRETDRFGLIVSTQVLIDGSFYGCGYTVTEMTEQGKIRLTADYIAARQSISVAGRLSLDMNLE